MILAKVLTAAGAKENSPGWLVPQTGESFQTLLYSLGIACQVCSLNVLLEHNQPTDDCYGGWMFYYHHPGRRI